jgi:hypothetical protein
LGVTILYIAAAAALGSPPDAEDGGVAVVAWFRENGDHVRLWGWLSVLTLPIGGVFAAFVRDRLPRVYRDVFALGFAALLATTAVQAWFWLGLAWHGADLDPATARTLLDIASLWGPVLTGATMLILGPIALLALRGDAGLPRWLGYIVGATFAEQLVETVTVFGKTGFIAPAGPMNLILGAGLFIVSFVAIGVVVARLPDDVVVRPHA